MNTSNFPLEVTGTALPTDSRVTVVASRVKGGAFGYTESPNAAGKAYQQPNALIVTPPSGGTTILVR